MIDLSWHKSRHRRKDKFKFCRRKLEKFEGSYIGSGKLWKCCNFWSYEPCCNYHHKYTGVNYEALVTLLHNNLGKSRDDIERLFRNRKGRYHKELLKATGLIRNRTNGHKIPPIDLDSSLVGWAGVYFDGNGILRDREIRGNYWIKPTSKRIRKEKLIENQLIFEREVKSRNTFATIHFIGAYYITKFYGKEQPKEKEEVFLILGKKFDLIKGRCSPKDPFAVRERFERVMIDGVGAGWDSYYFIIKKTGK